MEPFGFRKRKQKVHLKPLDTFGKQYCTRPTLRISQLIYKITNLWKFRLNWSSESGENNPLVFARFVSISPRFPHVSPRFENWYCFTVFSKSKAFHGITFQEKSSPLPSVNPVSDLSFCELFFSLLYGKGPITLTPYSSMTSVLAIFHKNKIIQE